jgi:hypothetical protein
MGNLKAALFHYIPFLRPKNRAEKKGGEAEILGAVFVFLTNSYH